MLSSTHFARRFLIAALPSFALIAGACADNDTWSPPSGAESGGSNAGSSGTAGKAGSSGAAGSSGSSGDAGEAGASGSSGDAGETGSAGTSGAAGHGGSSGAAGKGGTSGAAGNGGSSGTAGKGGAAGNGGSSGTAGKGGAAGNGGAAGSAGSSGHAGAGGGGNDVTAPSALSSVPAPAATNVAIQSAIRVTFSEAMDPSTLTTASFNVKLGSTTVAGQVGYFHKTATFTPNTPLALNSHYDVTVSTAAKDLAGNALATAHAWSFNTSLIAGLGPSPVALGTAANFAILAQSTVTNVPTSAITGNLGLSPAAASYITGFVPTKVGTYWTSPQVVGGIFAADNDAPTPSDLTTAVANMQTAYTDAAGRPTPDFTDLGAGTIGPTTAGSGPVQVGVVSLYPWQYFAGRRGQRRVDFSDHR